MAASEAPLTVAGMWVTQDGKLRQELLADNRYGEAHGGRRHAYQGRYEVTGTRIHYWDDIGLRLTVN